MLLRACLVRCFVPGLFAAVLGAVPVGPVPATLRAFLGQVPPQEKQNTSEETDEGSDSASLALTLRQTLGQHPPRRPDRHVPTTSLRPEPVELTTLLLNRRRAELPRRTAPPSGGDDDPGEPSRAV